MDLRQHVGHQAERRALKADGDPGSTQSLARKRSANPVTPLGVFGAPFSTEELRRGWPPLLLTVFAVAVLAAARRWVRVGRHADGLMEQGTLVLGLGATVILTWVLVSHYGGVSPWHAVWALVPGGSAIRVPVRIAHVLNVLVIGVAMWGLAAFVRSGVHAAGRARGARQRL